MLDEDSEGLIGIHCNPSCGNDIVQAFYLASVPTSSQIPEPGTSLVWLTGVGAIAALRLRQKRRTAKSISKKLVFRLGVVEPAFTGRSAFAADQAAFQHRQRRVAEIRR